MISYNEKLPLPECINFRNRLEGQLVLSVGLFGLVERVSNKRPRL